MTPNETARQLLEEHADYRGKCIKEMTALCARLAEHDNMKIVLFGKTCFELCWMMLVAQFGREVAIDTICRMVAGISQNSQWIEDVVAEIRGAR